MTDKRNGSPTFYALLADMAELHDRKSHDYAKNTDPSGNYRFAGTIANMFSHSPLDAGFAGRLAEEIYRLSVLESSGKEPKNESIDDTEQGIAVITALWMASRRDDRAAKKAVTMRSEDAACKIIELERELNPADRAQMISYLTNCQRDEVQNT